jgi:RHS repeat-associated protein
MDIRGSQILAWDVENRLISDNVSGNVTSFLYDGDGRRVKKTEGGQTTLYINQYYEVNLTTGNVTSSYYLGGKLIATSENGTLRYIHQDSLSSTSLMTDASGAQIGTTVKYLLFGEARATVTIPTDKLFTGQRLDGTGLYYYNARYYDPTIGRFISPDTVIQSMGNPQCFNRYSYCLNNPLKYTDPSGWNVKIEGIDFENFTVDDYLTMISFTPDKQKQFIEVLQAWEILQKVAPELAIAMEHSPQIITIQFDPNTGQGGTDWDKGFEKNGNMTISLGNKLQNNPEFLVVTLAHESFHAGNNLRPKGTKVFVDWGQSLWDESFAFGFGNAVGEKLGYNMSNIYAQNGYYNSCAGMNPFTYTGEYFVSLATDLRRSYGGSQTIPMWGNHILDILANAITYWVK